MDQRVQTCSLSKSLTYNSKMVQAHKNNAVASDFCELSKKNFLALVDVHSHNNYLAFKVILGSFLIF